MAKINNQEFAEMFSLSGETPEDIQQTCFQLSQKYLTGIWLQITIDDIEVRRLCGGLTNQLYYCGIKNKFQSISDEPTEVVIRLYGTKLMNNTDSEQIERVTDIVVNLLVSENGLGPKLFGLFKKGSIMAYYKNQLFSIEDQKDVNLLNELSSKLAGIHSMKVPIKKNDYWFLNTFEEYYETAYKRFPVNDSIKEYNCQTLMNNDLKTEIIWIKNLMIESKSPIVFTHNDFRPRNIMKTETNELIVCDFDHSSYGYRGIDFGHLFAEWGRSVTDFNHIQTFPEDFTIKPFIDNYISESIKINGKKYSENQNNCYEQILYEVKVFVLASNLFNTLTFLKNDKNSDEIPFERNVSLIISESSFKNYLALKKQFICRGIFRE